MLFYYLHGVCRLLLTEILLATFQKLDSYNKRITNSHRAGQVKAQKSTFQRSVPAFPHCLESILMCAWTLLIPMLHWKQPRRIEQWVNIDQMISHETQTCWLRREEKTRKKCFLTQRRGLALSKPHCRSSVAHVRPVASPSNPRHWKSQTCLEYINH